MKVLHLGSNELKKISKKKLNKIEARFAKEEQKMNSIKATKIVKW